MEKVKEEDKNTGGFSLSKDGISCFTCRCKRNVMNKTKKKQLMKTEGRQLKRISRRAHSVLEIEGLHLHFNREH